MTIARSFAGSPEAQPLAALKVFLADAVANENCDVIVATDSATDVITGVAVMGYSSAGWLGQNKALDEADGLLPPDAGAAYLSNMAVRARTHAPMRTRVPCVRVALC